jgi:hypothetical protein
MRRLDAGCKDARPQGHAATPPSMAGAAPVTFPSGPARQMRDEGATSSG